VKLIVGLGNPGPEYAHNRHNVGFQCVELLAQKYELSFDQLQFKARLARGCIRGQRVIVAKPLTFMNLSGQAVAPLVHFYKVELDDLLLVYDDLDLPLGKIRLRPEGGSGGHKGMQSVIQQLGTAHFPRMRVGIGRPPGCMDPADFVLQDFSVDEEAVMAGVRERVVAAIERWLEADIVVAMNEFNG